MLWLFVCVFNLFFNNDDLLKIREHYKLIDKTEASVIAIKELSQQSKSITTSLKNAYSAAAQMASAKYSINPVTKLQAFNLGKVKLEEAIQADINNIELRYIRISIQKNIPAILNYSKQITEDKQYIIKHLKTIKTNDVNLYKDVFTFMLYSFKLTADEKAELLN